MDPKDRTAGPGDAVGDLLSEASSRAALDLFREASSLVRGEPAAALARFREFVSRYPDHPQCVEAKQWMARLAAERQPGSRSAPVPSAPTEGRSRQPASAPAPTQGSEEVAPQEHIPGVAALEGIAALNLVASVLLALVFFVMASEARGDEGLIPAAVGVALLVEGLVFYGFARVFTSIARDVRLARRALEGVPRRRPAAPGSPRAASAPSPGPGPRVAAANRG